jgi:hypothetical protein
LRKKKFNLRKTYFFDETKRIESYLRRWFFCLVFSVSLFKFQVVFLFDTQNFSCTSVYLRHANKITKRLQSAICYFILFGPNVFFCCWKSSFWCSWFCWISYLEENKSTFKLRFKNHDFKLNI